MTTFLQPPAKEVDIDFLVFVQRYATDLLKWDILQFFAQNADIQITAAEIAQHIKRSARSLRPDLGDLALLGILDTARDGDSQTIYQLTHNPYLRKLALKFAH